MGLKGLRRDDRQALSSDQQAQNFILGASKRVAALQSVESSGRTFKRYTFSLTQATSDEIDRLSLVPREFHASRSDVVKAGLIALAALSEDKQIELINKIK